jgi:hypothetical protein
MFQTMTAKTRELLVEFQTLMTGRSSLIDSVAPPLVFGVVYTIVGLSWAIAGALAAASAIAILRLRRRQPLAYAAGGLAGVGLAAAVTLWMGTAESYFLPSVISGGVTLLAAVISLLVGRPMVAWTSFVARRWPLRWYWHPRVRPAYSEVTWLWVIFFALRFLLQLNLLQNQQATLLAVLTVLTGWPSTIVLLIASYLYGTWRLRQLGGPSVQEFRDGALPPWQGQTRGF